MVFALLIAAIVWNLGTWWFGLPASSLAYADRLDRRRRRHQRAAARPGRHGGRRLGAGDQDRLRAAAVAAVRLHLSALLLLLMKFLVRQPALYKAPTSDKPPPLWIRGLLTLTCTLVSFFHGSNDGQKGMGLIMLILIGVAPTAYALNRAVPELAYARLRRLGGSGGQGDLDPRGRLQRRPVRPRMGQSPHGPHRVRQQLRQGGRRDGAARPARQTLGVPVYRLLGGRDSRPAPATTASA